MDGTNPFAALEDVTDAVDTTAPRDDRRQQQQQPFLKYPLVWLDCEMTGLDVQKDTIIQIACIITDGNLELSVEGEEITIHHDEEVLAGMNAWSMEHHARSGLTQAVRDSDVTMAEAEARVLEFVQRHVPEPGAAQIAGNTVHMDVAFLRRHMPLVVEYLHYRIVDVSTVGELCRRWFPVEYGQSPKKTLAHTAMSDIRESVEQLRYYRRVMFRAGGSGSGSGKSRGSSRRC